MYTKQPKISKPERLIFVEQSGESAGLPDTFHKKTRDLLHALRSDIDSTFVLPDEKLNRSDLVKLDVDSLIGLEDKYPGVLLHIFTDDEEGEN